MREYARLAPGFWLSPVGRKLRARGTNELLLAVYLLSAPSSNSLGLYYLPKQTVQHELGMTTEGASNALRWCIQTGFCDYDEAAEMVYVPAMAGLQIAPNLAPADKRVKWVQSQYEMLPENRFLSKFFDDYGVAFHLKNRRGTATEKGRGIEGASKDHRSKDVDVDVDVVVVVVVVVLDFVAMSSAFRDFCMSNHFL